MPTKISSLALDGLEWVVVQVECDIARWLPSCTIVGLPDSSVQESRERVRAAIRNSGFEFPKTRITVNLAPGDARKRGPIFDLPIALGLLLEENEARSILQKSIFLGELGLDGSLQPFAGALPATACAKALGFSYVWLPYDNLKEASLVPGIAVFGMKNLGECVQALKSNTLPETVIPSLAERIVREKPKIDFSEILGQHLAKRGLLIAAAGGHNVLLEGPPGSGKTMLAKALPGILPSMTFDEMIEVSKVHSVVGLLSEEHPLVTQRPFRMVHHTASGPAIVGGGRDGRPGEISLAHRGVLFLDEFLEFSTSVLETLRQPLEDGIITVARANGTHTYPARCMLVGAYNPTPSGFDVDDPRAGPDSPAAERYRAKLSGPILDRIDIFLRVLRVDTEKLSLKNPKEETSESLQKKVECARQRQKDRFAGSAITCNADMGNKEVEQFCTLENGAEKLLQEATQRLKLSARAWFRILKTARTIADLSDRADISEIDVAEAVSYRKK